MNVFYAFIIKVSRISNFDFNRLMKPINSKTKQVLFKEKNLFDFFKR